MPFPRCTAIALLLLTALVRAQNPVPAEKQLADRLDALKDVATLEARFVCEKRLALLDTPLVSSGRVWIRRGEKSSENAVRFSTEKPYVSELILAEGKVYARSQHENEWAKSNQSSRPGLTAVMGELGGWATGDAGKLAQMYSVTAVDTAIPPKPAGADPAATLPANAPADTFLLTPTNKDLAKAVKQITLSVDRTAGTLLYIEIITQQDDATRYWFGNVDKNAQLPAGIIEPRDVPAPH
jgi:outer membrane lipoprotein-sorting protein